jgi:hypothetical protein
MHFGALMLCQCNIMHTELQETTEKNELKESYARYDKCVNWPCKPTKWYLLCIHEQMKLHSMIWPLVVPIIALIDQLAKHSSDHAGSFSS